MEKDLVRQVAKILHGYNMLLPDMHLGVAVSGGADSVTLLYILHSLAESFGYRLSVLHLNHQLRGAVSDQDEIFVRNLARSLSLPIACKTESVSAGNLEQEARRARQRFFQEWRAQLEPARVALGHTRSDQSETVLFRLLRGSGLAGLAGMAPLTQSGLIRPLLFTSRLEVREFAASVGLNWREDATNENLRFRRNKLRLVTLPQLSADYNPALEEVLARMAAIAADEEAFWERRIRKLYARIAKPTHLGLVIPVEELTQLPWAEQRRLLRRCVLTVRRNLRSIDSAHIDGILKVCQSNSGHDRLIIPGVDVIRSFQTLILAEPSMMQQPRSYALDVPLSEEVSLPFHLGKMIVNVANNEGQNCVTVNNAGTFSSEERYGDHGVMKPLSFGESLQVRNWEPGDMFQRQGVSRPEKIKTLFQENRTVLWERRHWPVLVVGGQIVWAKSFGVDDRFRPQAADRTLLQIRFTPAV